MYWTPGNYASGAAADYTDATETGQVAWYWDNSDTLPNSGFNSGRGTHPVGTAGNGSGEGTPLTGNANQLDIFDMSGNVWEWCFSESGGYRVYRGGSWYNATDPLRVGYVGNDPPGNDFIYVGFRIVRSVE
jgi:formylglycine-generating enzyme required for sulfatase activity